jgi:hypothetical protein
MLIKEFQISAAGTTFQDISNINWKYIKAEYIV